VAAYPDSLSIDVQNMVKEFAIKLLANVRSYLTVNGRRACLDALQRL